MDGDGSRRVELKLAICEFSGVNWGYIKYKTPVWGSMIHISGIRLWKISKLDERGFIERRDPEARCGGTGDYRGTPPCRIPEMQGWNRSN
jgi:hypothetical protein